MPGALDPTASFARCACESVVIEKIAMQTNVIIVEKRIITPLASALYPQS
jgi:hypothetical protein